MVATPIQGSFSLASPTGNQPKSFNWVVTATDRAKYDALFDSLNPVSGKLPGFKVVDQNVSVCHSEYNCAVLVSLGKRSVG